MEKHIKYISNKNTFVAHINTITISKNFLHFWAFLEHPINKIEFQTRKPQSLCGFKNCVCMTLRCVYKPHRAAMLYVGLAVLHEADN